MICMHLGSHVALLKEVDSFLPLCGKWSLNSGHVNHGKCLNLWSHLNSPRYSFKQASRWSQPKPHVTNRCFKMAHHSSKVVEWPQPMLWSIWASKSKCEAPVHQGNLTFTEEDIMWLKLYSFLLWKQEQDFSAFCCEPSELYPFDILPVMVMACQLKNVYTLCQKIKQLSLVFTMDSF